MLGKTESQRRRGQQRMRWLDSITNSKDLNLRRFQEIMEGRGVCVGGKWHKLCAPGRAEGEEIFGASASAAVLPMTLFPLGLILFRIDWFDLLTVQVTLKSLLHNLSTTIWKHQWFGAQPSLYTHRRQYQILWGMKTTNLQQISPQKRKSNSNTTLKVVIRLQERFLHPGKPPHQQRDPLGQEGSFRGLGKRALTTPWQEGQRTATQGVCCSPWGHQESATT